MIVDRSAQIRSIIEPIAKGGYYHAGQVCVSVQRIFVHEDIEAEFVERLVARVAALRVGDPLRAETEVGPADSPARGGPRVVVDRGGGSRRRLG